MKTLNKEELSKINPKKALNLLLEGNKRFMNNLKANRNLLQQVNETAEGQYPFAVILSCIDSRTSAELIFDQGLGDILSVRIAGNIVNEDILGSIEFSCKAIGAKIVVVLGHTNCGAIKGACDNVELGNVTTLLKKIMPAVDSEVETSNARNSANKQFVEKVSALNVKLNVNYIIKNSPILKTMIDAGEIGIVGGMYDLTTGEVNFYEDTKIFN